MSDFPCVIQMRFEVTASCYDYCDPVKVAQFIREQFNRSGSTDVTIHECKPITEAKP